MRRLKVLCLFDLLEAPKSPDFSAELQTDDWMTEADIVHALGELGHEVAMVGLLDRVEPLFEEVGRFQPDVVFNLTEQFGGDRSKDKCIASLLDLLGVPYTGACPEGLMLARDKALAKKILTYHRVKVPEFVLFEKGRPVRIPAHVRYPVIVKPVSEDASEGIARASLVRRDADLKQRVEWVIESYGTAAIVEQFIDGRELYCGLLGNERLRVLPLRELTMGSDPRRPKFLTYRLKWDSDMRQRWDIEFGFASGLDPAVVERIARVSRRVHRMLKMRDYARIDLRLTADNQIYVIEANPNPALAESDDVAQAAAEAGIDYPQLIGRILEMAMKRAGR